MCVQKLSPDEATGKARVTGKPSGLKQSQEYPCAYGEAVCELWHASHHGDRPDDSDDSDIDDDTERCWAIWRERSGACSFPEARLKSVAAFLSVPHDQILP